MYPITKKLLVELMPECAEAAESFCAPINTAFQEFKISTLESRAAFLAQAGHESVRFTSLMQSLNYSTKGLLRVYPNLFTEAEAVEYAHKPLRIASRIYANKFGNRDEASTDGWWYRSRGLFPRILGVNGYKRCGEALMGDPLVLLRRPELLSTPGGATRSAAWFWSVNGCEELAQQDQDTAFRILTKTINGGLHGLHDRLYLYEKAKRLLIRGPQLITRLPSGTNVSGTATADTEAILANREQYGTR